MKAKALLGMTVAAVIMACSAVGVFAADDNYSYNIGKEKMAQSGFTSEEKEIDTTGYNYRNGADKVREGYLTENAEERLAAGEITQEEFDAIKAEAKAKHERISARYSGISEMSPSERHQHFARFEDDEDVGAEV